MTTAWTPDVVTTDLGRAVRYTLLWGLDGMALRTVGGAGDRVPFVNESAVRARLADADLPVVAVAPGVFEGDAESRASWLNDVTVLEEAARFARRMGCSVVRVGALAAGERPGSAEALHAAGEVAQRVGLRLAVRNEAGTSVGTGAALAALLSDAGHASVGADWRPADAFASGEEPAAGLRALVERAVPLVTVGVRDGVRDGGAWIETMLGDGAVGWEAHVDALADAGVEGPLVLDALPGPAGSHGLETATRLVRLARRARRRA